MSSESTSRVITIRNFIMDASERTSAKQRWVRGMKKLSKGGSVRGQRIVAAVLLSHHLHIEVSIFSKSTVAPRYVLLNCGGDHSTA